MSPSEFLAALRSAVIERRDAREAYIDFTDGGLDGGTARLGHDAYTRGESRLRADIGIAERRIIDLAHDYFGIISPTPHNRGDNDNAKARARSFSDHETGDAPLDCLAEAESWQEALAIIEAARENGVEGITRDEAREVVRRRRTLIAESAAREAREG